MEEFKEKFGRNVIQIISKSELFSTSEKGEEPNSDPLANPYNCDHCDKWFGSRGALTQHLETKHNHKSRTVKHATIHTQPAHNQRTATAQPTHNPRTASALSANDQHTPSARPAHSQHAVTSAN